MALSIEILAEQLLELTHIISGHQRDIHMLQENCRHLEEHDQAIMVAFTTFFHVLAAGRVAPLHQISGILQTIIDVAEEEDRPPESVKFLQGLATMLLEHSLKRVDGSLGPGTSFGNN